MKYYGLYRGVVVANDDAAIPPGRIGRVQVAIPEVYGELPKDALPWAWPCNSVFGGGLYSTSTKKMVYTGTDSAAQIASGLIAIPPIGATAFVQFEQGDPQVPILMGTWISSPSEMPDAAVKSPYGQYPNVFLLKLPWLQNAYIRGSDNRMLEIVFGAMSITLEHDASANEDVKVSVTATKADIAVRTTEGEISLQGKTVTILADNDITVQAGTYKRSGDETVPDKPGTLHLYGSDAVELIAYAKALVAASKQGELQGRGKIVNGFETRDGTKQVVQ